MKQTMLFVLGALLLLNVVGMAVALDAAEDTSTQWRYVRPVPSSVTVASESEIIKHVGQGDFLNKVIQGDSYGLSDGNSVSVYILMYTYSLPVSTGQGSVNIVLKYDSSGNFVSYAGPTAMHKYSVTRDQVYDIARQNGLDNINSAEIKYVLNVPKRDSTSGLPNEQIAPSETDNRIDDVVWVVSASNGEIGSAEIYVDVDSGEVVARSYDSGARDSGSTSSGGSQATGGQSGFGGYFVIIILVLAAAAGVYFWKFYKK